MTNIALVIPSIRESALIDCLTKLAKNCKKEIPEFLTSIWIMEDFDQVQFTIPTNILDSVEINILCHNDIKDQWEEDAWIVSRKNAGCRIFGFWKAAQAGADIIVTLDDDCHVNSGFLSGHYNNLFKEWKTSKWVNSHPCTPTRGKPYGSLETIITPMISHGLWSGVLDLDGPQGLKSLRTMKQGISQQDGTINTFGTSIIPLGQYFPMCSMNLAFRKEILPIMFFPMMGEGWIYNRFDDIWAGVLAKRILDLNQYYVVNGDPVVNHTRMSDPFNNLIAEATGIKANETFWRLVDLIPLANTGSLTDQYYELADKLEWWIDDPMTINKDYLESLTKAMKIWTKLCKQIQL